VTSISIYLVRVDEPLSNDDAKRLIRALLVAGDFTLTGHAKRALADDRLEVGDVLNVLRGGWVEFSEPVGECWRYRVTTRTMCVVVEFASDAELVVVTAWRIG
jgi:hypothetical protein